MNLGWMEITVIIILALLFFGPSRLPGLGKSMGEAIRGFKKGISGKEDEPQQRDVTELNHDSKTDTQTQSQTTKNKQT
ncbi:MAG: twin-arginine translocase TatA/TatE family subunit [Bdellovibrionales bacterium]